MKDQGKLDQLQDAPETQRLFQMLSKNAGGDLEQAARTGRPWGSSNFAQLMDAVRRLTQDPEGQRLIQRLRQSPGLRRGRDLLPSIP